MPSAVGSPFLFLSSAHFDGRMFLPGEVGGEPLQHLSVSEAPGEELVRGSEKERETETGSQDSHWTEGHLLSAPTAA